MICDWWFKVDCSKSAELYEQSAELLAEEERKRNDARKIGSEYHRSSKEENGQENYQYVDYDGRQNGRSNPFGQSAAQNQIQDNHNTKNNEAYNQNINYKQPFNNRLGNQFSQNYKQHDLQDLTEGNTNFNQQQHSVILPNNNQQRQRQQNQSVEDQKEKSKQFNDVYDHRNGRKYQPIDQVQGKSEKQNIRTFKGRTPTYNDNSTITPRVTSTYTETTTFRTTSPSPVKELQQMAESSAFVTNRGNRYNKVFSSTQYNTNHYNNRITTDNSQKASTSAYSLSPNENDGPASLKPKIGSIPPFPGPTFTPIFKPRLTSSVNRGTTPRPSTFSQSLYSSYVNNNKNAQNYKQFTDSSTTLKNDQTKLSPSTQKTYVNTEYYRQSTMTPVTSTSYDSTPNYYDNTVTGNYNDETYSTSKPYTITKSYHQNTATMTTVTDFNGNTFSDNTVTPSPTTFTEQSQRSGHPKSYQDRENRQRNGIPFSTPSSSRTSQVYQLNSIITASTEKPFNQNTVPNKSVTSYDISLKNRQGKTASTSRPYVPFTKNYAYINSVNTSTQKPTIYTATVPSYSSTNSNYRNSYNDLVPKTKTSSSYSSTRSGTGATYLPKQTTAKEFSVTKKPILENRPLMEREHALDMIQSLQGLEGTIPELSTYQNGNRSGLSIPSSSGPSTLHSLALYFATASDNDASSNITESSVSEEHKSDASTKSENASVDLPTSILTQHTINSYAELFNLNKALENSTNFIFEDDSEEINTSDNSDDDLDIQQSEGPLNGVKKSNNTKLRELAQVFTHALSAYLQDPETFKKVLTEIRPTEPPPTSEEESGENTLSPTTTEEYPSVTKEKDEVLDFSDDTVGARRRHPTTPYPTLSTNPVTDSFQSQEDSTAEYFTTTVMVSESQYSTTSPSTQVNEVYNQNSLLSNKQRNSDNFAFEVNHALQEDLDLKSGSNIPSNSLNEFENYFPVEQNKISELKNNSREAYGKNVKPFDATPINNYVTSSTPSSFFQSDEQIIYGRNKESPVLDLEQDLKPPLFENFRNEAQVGNVASDSNSNQKTVSSTTEPFRIRYYDTVTKQKLGESLVTASSLYPNHKNDFRNLDNKLHPTGRSNHLFETNEAPRPVYTTTNFDQTSDGHWTSSPEVTRSWETTVFLNPQLNNQDLAHDSNQQSTLGPRLTDSKQFNSIPNQEFLTTDVSSEVTPKNFDSSTLWPWMSNNNDSPTAFTLLPPAFSTENTATPNPTYTTSSSITTTITSSITSTNAGLQETLVPKSVINVTENEIEKAEEMFGRLNASTSNTLMKVIKQADNNATVRQLVLLLISHCNGPMNKTMEEEKEQLLNALLKLPVNEFTSEESREIIAGISKFSVPIGSIRIDTQSDGIRSTQSSSTATEPSITTFRSRHGRKFKPTTSSPDANHPSSSNFGNAESQNSLVEDEASASDNRALELLRSLYSIAAKWG